MHLISIPAYLDGASESRLKRNVEDTSRSILEDNKFPHGSSMCPRAIGNPRPSSFETIAQFPHGTVLFRAVAEIPNNQMTALA